MSIEIRTSPALLSTNPDPDGFYPVPDGQILVAVLVPKEHAARLRIDTPVTLTVPDGPAVMPPRVTTTPDRVPNPVPATEHASLDPVTRDGYEYGLQLNDLEPQELFMGAANTDPGWMAGQCAAVENSRAKRHGATDITRPVRRLPGGEWERYL